MVSVTRTVFGALPAGAGTVEKFQLQSDQLRVDILSWGCTISALEVRDRQGRAADVVLGFAELEGYLQKQPYFGAVVGRVANRIAKGRFTLDGKEYQLTINREPNSLHGGTRGFDKASIFSPGDFPQDFPIYRKSLEEGLTPQIWGRYTWAGPASDISSDISWNHTGTTWSAATRVLWTPQVLPNGVQFSRVSVDGEEGYPGELKVWVTYTLDGGELTINYRAQTSRPTPISLTNHSYFNLAGQGSPDVYDHEVTIAADAFLPVDANLIPTGEVAPVQGTAFDLRTPVQLGKRLQELGLPGFDHNFCLERSGKRRLCARVRHAASGRVLEVSTTQPGVQFYTGNFLDGTLRGKGGATYPKHSGLCLETQNWPDAVNQPHFPPVMLRPGEEYNHTTWLTFSVA